MERKLSLLEKALEKYAEVPVQEAKVPVVHSVDTLSKELRDHSDALQREAEYDWDEVSNDPAQLVAFADSLAIVQVRESGCVPDTYTAVTNCQTCAGTVPIWQGCPPQVRECPWCMCGQTPPSIPGENE